MKIQIVGVEEINESSFLRIEYPELLCCIAEPGEVRARGGDPRGSGRNLVRREGGRRRAEAEVVPEVTPQRESRRRNRKCVSAFLSSVTV